MMRWSQWRCRPVVTAGIVLICVAAAVGEARAQVRIEAFAGEPFGVGRVALRLPQQILPAELGVDGVLLSEVDGRVLYPVTATKAVPDVVKGLFNQSDQPLGRFIGGFLNGPGKTDIYFLFRGSGPLTISIHSTRTETYTVRPRTNPSGHDRLFGQWWKEYTAEPSGLFASKPDYPPLVENYLRSMLAARFGLQLPVEQEFSLFDSELIEEIGLTASTESVRIDYQRERFLGPPMYSELADRPLPEPIAVPDLVVPDLVVPEVAEEVEIEPLALRVPAECLYVRFGSFANFLWIQDTLTKWGGDLQNLISLRGVDYAVKQRIEDQLAVSQSALAKLFGGTLVSDVALIGTDIYLQEGGSFGLLFEARNNMLLSADFNRQRQERLKEIEGATEESVSIAGHEVSFLSSPDGRLRSYYAVDGMYHLVTRSKTLVERFFETASGQNVLGTSPDFRHARSSMPLDREFTVFAYLSDAFFRNLVSPACRIETARRMQALADIQLVELARLAAAGEGEPSDSIEQLLAGGFLPSDFGPRADGSRTVLEQGVAVDSLRGHSGLFVPVADLPAESASRAEVDAYRRFADLYHSQCERLDPIVAGIWRETLPNGREHVVIDARMAPFSRPNYDRIRSFLGPPDDVRMAPIAGDMIGGDAILKDQRLFWGLSDFGPAPGMSGIIGLPLGRLSSMLVGYVGVDGPLGALSLLNLGFNRPADVHGYAQNLTGGWRRQFASFTVFSFHWEVLNAVTPQLHYEQAERPGQVRLRIDDLSDARITPLANDMAYGRTRDTSLGNLRLLHSLEQQLGVPGADCKATAEMLLDARLICPLRGEYVYTESPTGPNRWTSTALAGATRGDPLSTPAPDGFVAPPLNWLRGLSADLLATPEAMSIHAEVEMEMPEE